MGTSNAMLKLVPNALTLLRLALAPVVALAVWLGREGEGAWSAIALGLFGLGALTDLFDGMAARAFDAHSKFGRVIDPIADKALVGLPLIAVSTVLLLQGAAHGWIVAAASGVIVLRDVGITLLRMTARDGEGVRVSRLAKWKTTAEMIAVAAALIALRPPAVDGASALPWFTPVWVGLLVLAATLSAVTGVQYLAAIRRAPA